MPVKTGSFRPACNRPDNKIINTKTRHSDKYSNNDFPSFGPRKQIQKMRSHSLQLSSRQFVGPLRSSSFGRDARWNLNLGSRFSNRLNQKKKGKKRTESRKLRARSTMIVLRTCAQSRAQRSFRKRVATAKFEKSKSETRDEWHLSQFWPRFIEFYSLKQVVTRKTRLPDLRDCDNLPGPAYL